GGGGGGGGGARPPPRLPGGAGTSVGTGSRVTEPPDRGPGRYVDLAPSNGITVDRVATPAAAPPPPAAIALPPSSAPPAPPEGLLTGAPAREDTDAEPAAPRSVRPKVGYALHGGEADANRLAAQSRALEPGTVEFLTSLGLRPGWRCLDVGCGHGQVSVLLAGRVRPGGQVVGIDASPASLAVARHNAARVGARIAWMNADASWLPVARGAFDLAYSRLLLGHLAEPVATLRAMAASVRPGGVVAVEDIYFGYAAGAGSALANPAIAEFFDLMSMTIRVRGGDPMIGPRLPALLTAAGLVDVTVNVRPSPLTGDPSGRLVEEALEATHGTALSAGLVTAEGLDQLREALGSLSRAELTEATGAARLYQVAGHRPVHRHRHPD
ncbi:class I SAM-dependent methyltransferase, partial [Frankia sp. AgW1.1]|uniref:class I SAM-dependent methyltransferase n=1 Tax=Frankia sp. AgW1.1 TaxID=1836971 RepID=UPI0019330537